MSYEYGGFILPFDPFTPAAAPAKPWLDACAYATEAMTEWNRRLIGARPASSASPDAPEPTFLKPGLSPMDQALDQWRQYIGWWLSQTRGQVDASIDAWFTGLKFAAGALATASPCQTDSASDNMVAPRRSGMASGSRRAARKASNSSQHT